MVTTAEVRTTTRTHDERIEAAERRAIHAMEAALKARAESARAASKYDPATGEGDEELDRAGRAAGAAQYRAERAIREAIQETRTIIRDLRSRVGELDPGGAR